MAFQLRAHMVRIEQPEWALEDRAQLVAGFQHVNRELLHQQLQPLGNRGFAAADRAEEIENLLALLQALGGIAEIIHDPLNRVLHAEKFREGRIDLDRAVHENPAKPGILGGIDHLGFADGGNHALSGGGVGKRIAAAEVEVLQQGHLLLSLVLVGLQGTREKLINHTHPLLLSHNFNAFLTLRVYLNPLSSGSGQTRTPQHQAQYSLPKFDPKIQTRILATPNFRDPKF